MSARHRRCPTPGKVEYASLGAARFALRKMPIDRIECRAYKCKGHWHVTSGPRR